MNRSCDHVTRKSAFGGYLFDWCCILAGLAGSPALADVQPAIPTGYSFQWSDEFNGTTLNTSTWQEMHPGTTLPDSYQVSDGTLKMIAYTNADGVDREAYVGTPQNDSTGYEQTYGYFVARIKLNDKQGAYSAFWMYSPALYTPGASPPALTGNPGIDGMEIDIFEHREFDENNNRVGGRTESNLHWYTPDHHSSLCITGDVGLNDGNFHLYSLLWTPTKYEFYIDNVLYRTFTEAISQRSEYFVLTSAPTGIWGGTRPLMGYGPPGSASNSVLTIDYIRAYALPEPNSLVLLGTVLASGWAYAWRHRR